MNGPELPLGHGAPLRLKVARQLGYKNLKYLSRITVTDRGEGIGDGLGSRPPAAGYSWYAGIYTRRGSAPVASSHSYVSRF
jgi:DMSO/TMAO reductase YedYZ molybdopterin-dependent catalytic subunit